MRQFYRKLRHSGVEWLGDIPAHWSVGRLKNSARCWVSNVDKVPSEEELPVRLCNYTDVYYNENIRPAIGLMETTATAEEIRRFGLQINDVLITKDSEEWNDIAVPALVVETAPDLVCGYHLAIIRPNLKKVQGRFLLRALQSCAINQQFQVAASGVTRYGLPKTSIGEAWIPLPSYTEQTAIAAFLDRKTAEIDSLVSKKRAFIEKLKEERSALISRTVTRGLPPREARAVGLNPNPKMKPSHIEWLGDVPEHWDITRIRRVAERLETGGTPPTIREDFYEDGTLAWFGPGSFDDQIVLTKPIKLLNRTAVEEGAARVFGAGATLIVTIGATLGKVSSLAEEASCNQQITVVEFDQTRIIPRYGTYQIKRLEPILRAIAPSATLPILTQRDIADIVMLVPPLPEQLAIDDFLDRETARIDSLIVKVEQAIERLQEYRTALITAAVTGKIDVRTEKSAHQLSAGAAR